MASTEQTALESENSPQDEQRPLIQRVFPFSPDALALLPKLPRPRRYTRADAIPETQPDSAGEQPTVRDYHAINLPPQVRVPKKMPTPIRVEGKVWFANERTWVSWLNISIILATLSMALYNASKDDIATYFAYTYAVISICVLIYSWALYQYRISLIRRRDPGHFDNLWGPVVLSIVLFSAILANFIIRVRELHRKGVPIPGADLLGFASSQNQTIVTGLDHQQHPF